MRSNGGAPPLHRGHGSSYPEHKETNVGSTFIQTGREDFYLTGATDADYDFIAAARQDVPALIAEVRRLRQVGTEN
jgi:hypothetical protein